MGKRVGRSVGDGAGLAVSGISVGLGVEVSAGRLVAVDCSGTVDVIPCDGVSEGFTPAPVGVTLQEVSKKRKNRTRYTFMIFSFIAER